MVDHSKKGGWEGQRTTLGGYTAAPQLPYPCCQLLSYKRTCNSACTGHASPTLSSKYSTSSSRSFIISVCRAASSALPCGRPSVDAWHRSAVRGAPLLHDKMWL